MEATVVGQLDEIVVDIRVVSVKGDLSDFMYFDM